MLSGGNWPPVADILASEVEEEGEEGSYLVYTYTPRCRRGVGLP